MSVAIISQQQYEEAQERKKQAEEIINTFLRQKRELFDERIKSGVPFTDDELIYSAHALCPCGHGMAYPRDCGPGYHWDCSAILKGVASTDVKHTDRPPFAFYEVKSEGQPSANGATTRGVFRPQVVPSKETPTSS